jgi:hypothetical protein
MLVNRHIVLEIEAFSNVHIFTCAPFSNTFYIRTAHDARIRSIQSVRNSADILSKHTTCMRSPFLMLSLANIACSIVCLHRFLHHLQTGMPTHTHTGGSHCDDITRFAPINGRNSRRLLLLDKHAHGQ